MIPLISSVFSGIWDAITGEIPEAVTVPTLFLGILFAFTHGYGWDALLMVGVTLLFGYALYYTGQLGGGDVLLMAALSAWFPWFMSIPLPLYLFLTSTILSALFYTVFYALWTRERTYVLALLPYLALPLPLLLPYALSLYYILGTRAREKIFVKEISVDELQPEDVLAEDVEGLPPGRRVVGRKEIEALKKKGIKRVKILVNLPRLGPFIALAFLPVFLAESYAVDLYPALLALFSLHIKLHV